MTINYEEIEIESLAGVQKHIVIDLGDGAFKSFPADETNPEYVAFQNELNGVTPEIPALPVTE
jgi:hypothetical protein